MRKILALMILLFGIGLINMTFGQEVNGTKNETQIKSEVSKLEHSGIQVFKNKRLLSIQEVESELSPYPKILNQYQNGWKLRNAGYMMFAGGAVSIVGGIVLMSNGIEKNSESGYYNGGYYEETSDINGKFVAGYFGVVLGVLLLDGGIACTVIGKIKIKRSINNFNRANNLTELANPNSLNYQIGLLDNGNVGVRLRF